MHVCVADVCTEATAWLGSLVSLSPRPVSLAIGSGLLWINSAEADTSILQEYKKPCNLMIPYQIRDDTIPNKR